MWYVYLNTIGMFRHLRHLFIDRSPFSCTCDLPWREHNWMNGGWFITTMCYRYQLCVFFSTTVMKSQESLWIHSKFFDNQLSSFTWSCSRDYEDSDHCVGVIRCCSMLSSFGVGSLGSYWVFLHSGLFVRHHQQRIGKSISYWWWFAFIRYLLLH